MIDNESSPITSVELTQLQQAQPPSASDILKQNIQDIHTNNYQQINTPNITQTKNQHLAYRSDIDGLRAIAIISVLIFHAFPKAIPGGFIGVDVFFIISGFLISSIIIKQCNQQKFSYTNFYIRRIKRIYPALILILLFALYIIRKLASNFQNVQFQQGTLNASLVFGANIQILSHEKGYFDPDIHRNPLLHLWSLGVQEQFYIVWPFFLVLILTFFKKKALLILSLFTVLSFIFSIIAIHLNQKLAFYFPICRFWQMSIGGILALQNIKIQNKIINQILSTIGLITFLITIVILNSQSSFPGFWALLPSLSAAFIIQARNQTFINKYILSSKFFVFIGKISYSLYLWHWPLLVYSKYFYPHGSTSILSNTYFIVFLAVAFSILTYYNVENPVRKSKSKQLSVSVLILIMILIGICSIYFSLEDFSKLQKDEQKKRQLVEKFELQMAPGGGDYYEKDGKKIPNFSFNKNRIQPNKLKLKAPEITRKYFDDMKNWLVLQKYAETIPELNAIDRPEIHMYQVSNQGQNNKLLLIGDSHARSIGYRFQKLYQESKKEGKQFPTVLGAITLGHALIEQNNILNVTRQIVAKWRPQRIIMSCGWQGYVCEDFCGALYSQAVCDTQKINQYVKEFVNFALQMRSKGVQVSTLGVNIDYWQYHPFNMMDANGIIDENIKPFKYSDFRKRYRVLIETFETTVKAANIPIINLVDNLCWQDQCHTISSKGYPAYLDCQHLYQYYSSQWLSVLDHLVEF